MTIPLLGAVSLYFFRRTLVDSAQQSTMQFAAQLSRIVDNSDLVYERHRPRSDGGPGRPRTTWRPLRQAPHGQVQDCALSRLDPKVRKDIDGVSSSGRRGAASDVLPAYVIASSPGQGIDPDYDFKRFACVRSLASGADDPYVSSAHVDNMIDGRYPWVISLVREMRGGDGSILGYIQVDLNYAIIEDLCRDMPSSARRATSSSSEPRATSSTIRASSSSIAT